MPADEILPSGRLTPFRCWCDVVVPQDVADGLVREAMAQVGQRTDDAVVTPARVLAQRSEPPALPPRVRPRSARIGAAFGTVELAGDQPPIPPEDGVRLAVQATGFSPLRPSRFRSRRVRTALDRSTGVGWAALLSQDAGLGGQVLILQQQLRIDEARHKGQKACPIDGVAHVEGSS